MALSQYFKPLIINSITINNIPISQICIFEIINFNKHGIETYVD